MGAWATAYEGLFAGVLTASAIHGTLASSSSHLALGLRASRCPPGSVLDEQGAPTPIIPFWLYRGPQGPQILPHLQSSPASIMSLVYWVPPTPHNHIIRTQVPSPCHAGSYLKHFIRNTNLYTAQLLTSPNVFLALPILGNRTSSTQLLRFKLSPVTGSAPYWFRLSPFILLTSRSH